MKQLLIALGVVVVVVALVSIADRLRERSYSEIVADQARAAAIQRRYEVDTALYAEWAPRITWGLALCVVLVIAYLAGLGAAHVRSKWTLTKPDAHGLLPVQLGDNDAAVAALLAYHNARIAEASRQPVPERLHYAPRVDYRIPSSSSPGTAAGDVQQAVVPSFADLLTAGRIGRGRALCLGYDLTTGEGVWGDWRDLFSAGVGGMQGSGKTWTAASIVAQSLLHSAQVVLCDPHAGDSESLTSRLEPLLPMVSLVAETPDEIIQSVRYARDELERRKASSTKQCDRRPLIIVIDEWTALVRTTGEELTGAISAITTEGRKYRVFALLLAQRWSAAAAGGSDIRNTLTAHYVHRMRQDEARLMTGLRAGALPSDTGALHPGQAYLLDTRGEIRKVATPHMDQRDLVRVAQLLNEQHTAAASQATQREVVPEAAREAAREVARNEPLPAQQNAVKWTAEELRIISALRSGKTPGEVASELAGVKGGQKYQSAARLVADVIRRALDRIE